MRKTVFNDDINYKLPRNCGEDFFNKYRRTKLYEGYLMINMPKNSSFLDVGAHNGDVVLTMAIYAKKINREDIRFFCFEPDEIKANFIKDTAKNNSLDIKVYCCAVGDKECMVSRQKDVAEHSGAVSYKINKSENNINMINLNSLSEELGEVGFLHLDTEGWEEKVLSGSSIILEKYNPIIVAEYWSSSDGRKRGFSQTAREDIINIMNNYEKYKLFDTIVDANTNLVFIPNDMLIEKKSSDELFETNEFKKR